MPHLLTGPGDLFCRWNMFDRAHIALGQGLGPSLLQQRLQFEAQVRAWMRVISRTGSDVQNQFEIGNTTAHHLSLEVVLCALLQHGILAHVNCGPNTPARGPKQELYPQCVQELDCRGRGPKVQAGRNSYPGARSRQPQIPVCTRPPNRENAIRVRAQAAAVVGLPVRAVEPGPRLS